MEKNGKKSGKPFKLTHLIAVGAICLIIGFFAGLWFVGGNPGYNTFDAGTEIPQLMTETFADVKSSNPAGNGMSPVVFDPRMNELPFSKNVILGKLITVIPPANLVYVCNGSVCSSGGALEISDNAIWVNRQAYASVAMCFNSASGKYYLVIGDVAKDGSIGSWAKALELCPEINPGLG